MTFRLTILGSSSALPTVTKYPSAHALNVHEQIFLLDAGEGVQTQLLRYGINKLRIDHIFITHLHGDHFYGLFGLISSMNLMGRAKALHIYAPAPLREVMECHLRFFESHLRFPLHCQEVDARVHQCIFENKAVEVWTVPMRHRVPACGYLFREKQPPLNVRKYAIEKYGLTVGQIRAAKSGEDVVGDAGQLLSNAELTYRPYVPRSFAYCTDTLYSGKVRELVRGVDLLYHEATFLDEDRKTAKATGHSTALQAATLAREAGVGRLVIGHFSSRYKNDGLFLEEARSVFAPTDVAREGVTFGVPVKNGVQDR